MPGLSPNCVAVGDHYPVKPQRGRWSWTVGLATFCIAAVLLLSACGSSSSSTSSGGASNASASTKAPVKLGFFVNLTGTDTQYPDALAGAKAAVAGLNKTGGINGHPVDLESCDVQSSVDVAEQCGRDFISDHVVAVVGNDTNYGPQETALLQSAHIPNIADDALNASSQFSSPVEFPVTPGFVGDFAAGTYYGLKLAGFHSFAFVGAEQPVVAALQSSVESAVKKEGGIWKGDVAVPVTTTSFAPYVAAAAAKHADLTYLAMSPQQSSEFALAAESAGDDFHTYVTAIAEPPSVVATLGPNTPFAKAILFGGPLPPPSATSQYPVLNQFLSDMSAEAQSGDKYAAAQYRSLAQEFDWYAVHIAALVAQKVSGPITAASMLAELHAAQNLNIGLQPPWTPSASGPAGFKRINSWNEYMLRLVNGKLALAYPKPFNVESFVGQ
jgi:hypothetical protein